MSDDEVRAAAAARWRAYNAVPPIRRDARMRREASEDMATLADAVLAWEDAIAVAAATPPLCDAPDFRVGDPVRKVGGDYTLDGVVRGVVVKASGAVRYAVEDARGVLMIYSASNLERLP